MATLAKLGEKTTTGGWIYALGNGLRTEFQKSKDGILYNNNGYDTIISVKTKLINEEAVITAKSKNQSQTDSNDKEKADEIAMKLKDNKGKELKLTEEQPLLYANDKGKKGTHSKGKRKWNDSNQQ